MRFRSRSTAAAISIATLKRARPRFDQVAALIEALAVELGEALLGRQFATAAE